MLPKQTLNRTGYCRGTVGALIIRIGFWGILYYPYDEGHPKYG